MHTIRLLYHDGQENPKRPQPYTKYDRQIRNVKNWRNDLPQGREYQLLMQYQIVMSENVHTTNITQTE